MKYVVLSFDDGLQNFADNAFPILEKYGFKASVNVISGYSDKTIDNEYNYITYDTIKFLADRGYEIANHTNSHLKPTSLMDFEKCETKLDTLLGKEKRGAVLPFSQGIATNMLANLQDRYLYVVDAWDNTYLKKKKNKLIYKIARYLGNKKVIFYYNNLSYIYNINYLNKSCPCIKRLPIKKMNDPELYYYLIKKLKKEECISIMFHSVVNDVKEKTPYPDGDWTIKQFSRFVEFLSKDSSICVLTQKELVLISQGK